MTIARLDRRAFLQTVAAVGALVTGTPGAALAQGVPRRGGHLKASFSRRPNHLNPLRHVNDAEYFLGEMMYSNLTRLDGKMQASPDLATSWSANADATQWTFKLRRGVKFHGGGELIAKDVVATLRAVLDPKTASPARTNVGPIDAVTDLDAETVQITMKTPYGNLPIMMAFTAARIVPTAVLERDLKELETKDFGTGPFMLKSHDPARATVLVRNPDYFIKDVPYLDQVEQVIYPDATAEIAAYLNGETDLIIDVPPPEFDRVAKSPNTDALRTPSGRFLDLVLGTDTKPFNDVRVRRALQLAIDRDQLAAILLEGYGQPGNDTPLADAYRFHKSLLPIKRDVARAKALLAEAGYANGLEITLICANSPPLRTGLGVAVKEMARPAGFNINVQTMPYDTYLKQVWKQGNFYVGYYNMQPTEDGIFSLLYTSDAVWNQTRWNNAAFDALVRDARGTTDDKKRMELYGRAQELMRDEVPSIVPLFLDLIGAKKKYVRDFRLHPRGAIYDMEKVWLADGAPKRA